MPWSRRATRCSATRSEAATWRVVRHSVMEVLLELPDTTRVLPGHTDETTIGRERRENPFIRVWSGAEAGGE